MTLAYDPVKTRLLESEEEEEGRTNQSQGLKSSVVIGLFFRFCLQLRQCSFNYM